MTMIFSLQAMRNSKTQLQQIYDRNIYLSLNLCYKGDKITINQKEYTKNLECVNIERCLKHNLFEPLSNDMKHILRQKVGQLLWVCNQSRPDICFMSAKLHQILKTQLLNSWLISTKQSTKRKEISMIENSNQSKNNRK